MLTRWQLWATTVVALVVAVLVGYDIWTFGQNRAVQAELSQRTQYVQQSIQLEALYREIVKALADLSVRSQDKALSDLLASQGITVSAPPAVDSRKTVKP